MEAVDQFEGDDSYLDYLDILLGPADSLTNSICSSGGVVDVDFSSSGGAVTQFKECSRKRFQDLSSVLEPGRPAKTDKPAILDDAIRVLNQLKNEAQELKETNEKLLEEIKSLKAEKTELREEKLMLKADKEKMEQQLKTVALPPSGFMPAYPAAYHAAANKMPVFPSYGLMPMWHYLPPAACDTSRDHELRPPAA
uniref:BHLH domain-containing protein n=1 Tax=Salix viminalis TaxID=40686 RepID=A0A6N2NHE3_SALVM